MKDPRIIAALEMLRESRERLALVRAAAVSQSTDTVTLHADVAEILIIAAQAAMEGVE